MSSSSEVAVLRFDSTWLLPLRRLLAIAPGLGVATHDNLAEAGLELVGHIRRRFGTSAIHAVHGLSQYPPGLETVTVDRGTGFRLGLHIDNWDRLALNCRAGSQPRLCINIGPEHRYFLFVPQTVQSIANAVCDGDRPNAEMALSHESLLDLFFKQLSSGPVVRIKLKPDEAYIAQTDNLIHDASTVGTERAGWTFTVRGRFV
jgi:hypothetical protein